VALVRKPSRAGDLAAWGVTLHLGDVTNRESLRAGMAGADGVFHCAGWYRLGARDRRAATAVNVEGTRNVLGLMQQSGIPKGVYTSTLAAFSDTHGRLVDESYRFRGKHLTEYDRTKWQAHYEVALLLMEQGLPLVIVQPGVVYGPGDHSPVHDFFLQYLRGRLRAAPRRTAYCWAHVEDVARGHILAMERGRPGESYILGGSAHSVTEVLDLAERITGIRAPRWRIPPGLLKTLAVVLQPVAAILPLSGAYHPESLRAVAGVTYLGDNTKARRELGYGPRGLEEGLRETLAEEMKRLTTPLVTK
jgi:nucleoside-diphosphate-sugar epimerase